MGLTIWKKGIWVLLFFSLALNVGFIFTAVSWKFWPGPPPPPYGPGMGGPGPGMRGPGPGGPGPGPILEIINRMDLSEAVRKEVTDIIIKLDADHRRFVRQLFEEEEKILMLMGRPGEVDMDMVAPLIESYTQISKKSALNKAGYVIEMRKLLGNEKIAYLISEMKKNFRKRMHEDKSQG